MWRELFALHLPNYSRISVDFTASAALSRGLSGRSPKAC
jgi:hypothetical protein